MKNNDTHSLLSRTFKKTFIFLILFFLCATLWALKVSIQNKSYYEEDGKGRTIYTTDERPYLCMSFRGGGYSPCTKENFFSFDIWLIPIFVFSIGIILFVNPKTAPFAFLALFLLFGSIYSYEKIMFKKREKQPNEKNI